MPDACTYIVILQRLHLHPLGLPPDEQCRPAFQQDEHFIRQDVPFQFGDILFVEARRPVEGRERPFGVVDEAAVFSTAKFQNVKTFHHINR